MAKVSVIIPARNERYLIPTVDNLLAQARGEVEVVVILEDFGQLVEDRSGQRVLTTPTATEWAMVQDRHGDRLHTIYHHEAKGMRPAINAGAASAISRGAKYLAKFDAHCAFGEGWDEILKADCDKDWIVVPRRKRLDPDTFAPRTDGRPDIDYHYLSFPDNVNDFGGPGLNGKVWDQRARERLAIDIDDEMSSQGSGWFMHADYFTQLELMDTVSYGPFWNEFQELGMKSWLGGGQVKVNKRTWYAHWHKGSAGRGYSLPKDWLSTGATFTKRWLFNDAWAKQTRPFSWLIEHFWPVPTWPENWEVLVYGDRAKAVVVPVSTGSQPADSGGGSVSNLQIHTAFYGVGGGDDINVKPLLESMIVNGSLDIVVTNESLKVGNPFRGIKKQLRVSYSYNGGELTYVTKDERDWLIIGQSARYVKLPPMQMQMTVDEHGAEGVKVTILEDKLDSHLSPQALIDKLIRKFNIPSHRLRGPSPIEVPSFHRNDLAQLFAELGFTHGAEIGVAEANYSEVLCKANPNIHLLCVDPWHHYSGNPQGKSKEKNEYAFNETKRKLAPYPNVELIPKLSMDAVNKVQHDSLDFVYIDGHHGFDYVMQDLIEWSKRVRSGGIVAGDDYYYLDPKRWGAGPVEAVNAYTKAHQINPWFIFNAHKSVDFMWVKP